MLLFELLPKKTWFLNLWSEKHVGQYVICGTLGHFKGLTKVHSFISLTWTAVSVRVELMREIVYLPMYHFHECPAQTAIAQQTLEIDTS